MKQILSLLFVLCIVSCGTTKIDKTYTNKLDMETADSSSCSISVSEEKDSLSEKESSIESSSSVSSSSSVEEWETIVTEWTNPDGTSYKQTIDKGRKSKESTDSSAYYSAREKELTLIKEKADSLSLVVRNLKSKMSIEEQKYYKKDKKYGFSIDSINTFIIFVAGILVGIIATIYVILSRYVKRKITKA